MGSSAGDRAAKRMRSSEAGGSWSHTHGPGVPVRAEVPPLSSRAEGKLPASRTAPSSSELTGSSTGDRAAKRMRSSEAGGGVVLKWLEEGVLIDPAAHHQWYTPHMNWRGVSMVHIGELDVKSREPEHYVQAFIIMFRPLVGRRQGCEQGAPPENPLPSAGGPFCC